MDILDDAEPATGGNAPEFTVSEISGAVKRALEDRFGRVRVRGEVGRVSRPSSGHVYLDLKDDRAVLASVIWKARAGALGMRPEQGDEVIAEGRITTFAGQSRYQLVIESMAYAGEGALLAKLERLKRALGEEGLFDAARKRPTPWLPEVLGVVTSPSGAVIRDILHRLEERFPRHVLLWPVAVQGANCAAEVAAAVRGFNALTHDGPVPRPDVLIVARGGGSIEDLWGFNEEIVVRAVAESAIPVISAVGHETDTTLIDFAADRRAPTPTAAAEFAVPVRAELAAAVAGLGERGARAAARALTERGARLAAASRLLPAPEQLLAEPRQRLDRARGDLPRALSGLAARRRLAFARGPAGRFGPALLRQPVALRRGALSDRGARLAPALARSAARARREAAALLRRLVPDRVARGLRLRREAEATLGRRLDRAGGARLAEERARLDRAARLLRSLSYKATLERGFAVVRGPDGPVTRAAGIGPGDALSLEFADGRAAAVGGGGGARPSGGRRRPAPKQGSLF